MIDFASAASTASAPSRQTVGTSSGAILAANPARKRCIVINVGTTVVYLGFGQTPTVTAYHVGLAPCANYADDGSGGSFVIDVWDGAINAISSAAGGAVCVTELTA